MLVTKQPVLRRFWYAVMPEGHLADGPKPFRLLGQDIVLWRDGEGRYAALADRCCHRTAKLSKGFYCGGRLACGYHGWEYDADGIVVRIPQRPAGDQDRPTGLKVEKFHAAARYGYVWVALEEPLHDIPDLPEAGDPAFRQIHEFYEVWKTAGLRIMENSFDNAHFSFVHRESFGILENPDVGKVSIEQQPWGFLMTTAMPVKNPQIQKDILGLAEEHTTRYMRSSWFMPFSRSLKITYPNGRIHIIVTLTAPIDDEHSQVVQFVIRNDTEAEAPAEQVIAFDRQVTAEDKEILESTGFDVPLTAYAAKEADMPSDRPGVEMRRRLARLLREHGESEVRLGSAPLSAAAD